MFIKVCNRCSSSFDGVGPASLYCEVCRAHRIVEIKEDNRLRIAKRRVASGEIKNPGVGKGGANVRGVKASGYKHGKYTFETVRNFLKEERRFCERCAADLIEATHYFWVVHHKDHNHWNHSLDNLELLCKRCHQVEHECWKAFTKEQRLSRKGVEASASKC